MSAADVLKIKPWNGIDFLLMFLMWAVMMVGMMTPTAIPMTLIYAAVARKAATQGTRSPRRRCLLAATSRCGRFSASPPQRRNGG